MSRLELNEEVQGDVPGKVMILHTVGFIDDAAQVEFSFHDTLEEALAAISYKSAADL